AIVTSGALHGVLEGGAARVELKLKTDRDLMTAIQGAIAAAGIPIIGLSYGGNDPPTATMPVDWATQIPLPFMGRAAVPAVVIAPARDLSWALHVAAGRAIGAVAASSSKRIAVIASCDHGHGHDAKGPYGFTEKSKEFDDRVVDIVKRNALGDLLTFGPTF